MSKPHIFLLSALAALLAVAATSASAGTTSPATNSCFATKDWRGWTAPGDGDALYLRVGTREIYRVELLPGSHVRKRSDTILFNRVRGSSWICSPLDLDLTLADRDIGFRQSLIARSIRKLTPEEIAAIPRKDLP
jgi:hypothetical protein